MAMNILFVSVFFTRLTDPRGKLIVLSGFPLGLYVSSWNTEVSNEIEPLMAKNPLGKQIIFIILSKEVLILWNKAPVNKFVTRII